MRTCMLRHSHVPARRAHALCLGANRGKAMGLCLGANKCPGGS